MIKSFATFARIHWSSEYKEYLAEKSGHIQHMKIENGQNKLLKLLSSMVAKNISLKIGQETMTSTAKTIIGRGFMIVLKRISWRIQPIEQIRKRKQRKRDMWERHEKFAEYVEKVKKKKKN